MARLPLLYILPLYLTLTACQGVNLKNISENPLGQLKVGLEKLSSPKVEMPKSSKNSAEKLDLKGMSLEDLMSGAKASVNLSSGFVASLRSAVQTDPQIIAAKDELRSRKIGIDVIEAGKDFQVSGTVYGGIEDVSEETAGVALDLRANKLLYDGGLVDFQIVAENKSVESLEHALDAQLNQRTFELASIWVDLERYQTLNQLIEGRLKILDPLIVQLETVAKAGVGDVSRVAAAQRTVSMIRVTQTDVSESLSQAKLSFDNAFGSVPEKGLYDSLLITKNVPSKITEEMTKRAPVILSEYAAYLSAEAFLASVRAREKFTVGFEARAVTPFGGSDYDKKESLGLVINKTLYNGKMTSSEIEQAQAALASSKARLKSTARQGEQAVKTAQQTIQSMDRAIELARQNAEVLTEEIVYLKQQLIIGGSTLDSVLSSEASLYEAESKEINFMAERRKAELAILAGLGLLAPLVGF